MRTPATVKQEDEENKVGQKRKRLDTKDEKEDKDPQKRIKIDGNEKDENKNDQLKNEPLKAPPDIKVSKKE